MRQPFSSLGNFITRDVLGLARSSILERYTNLFAVFLISSFYHVVVDLLQSVPPQYSWSLPFYMSFVVGIMLEDGVQELWGRLVAHDGASTSKESTPAEDHWIIVGRGMACHHIDVVLHSDDTIDWSRCDHGAF
jgi:hypothetical protein